MPPSGGGNSGGNGGGAEGGQAGGGYEPPEVYERNRNFNTVQYEERSAPVNTGIGTAGPAATPFADAYFRAKEESAAPMDPSASCSRTSWASDAKHAARQPADGKLCG